MACSHVRVSLDLHGSDTALCPPSLRRYDRGEFDHEATQHERAGLHRARRGRSFQSELAYAGPHARTHAGWWWWCWWSPRFLPRPLARRVCDVGLTEERAHGENGNGAPRHRARRIARAHARTSERACCCGCGMWVVVRCAFGRTRAAARDARDARAACNVSARAGTARGVEWSACFWVNSAGLDAPAPSCRLLIRVFHAFPATRG